MRDIVLTIDGMKCGGCAVQVREALEAVEGVRDVDVSVDAGRARLRADEEVEQLVLEDAVRRAGFEAAAAG